MLTGVIKQRSTESGFFQLVDWIWLCMNGVEESIELA